MRVVWWSESWQQYTSWQDRKVVRRINELIKDIERNGNSGIGDIEILSCRGHYT